MIAASAFNRMQIYVCRFVCAIVWLGMCEGDK